MSQDRTLEFQSALASLRSRPSHPSSHPLLPSSPSSSPFTSQASTLSLRITATASKLERLSALARRKTIFDDKPQEIQALSQQIKAEINEINTQISNLQKTTENNRTGNNTTKEHTKNVLTSLQTNLAETTTVFGEVLEMRTKTMQDMQKRKREFEFAVQPSPSAYNNPSSGGQMQQQLMMGEDQSQQYTGARSEAIDSIQEMVGELGQVFTRLSSLLATQGEAVMRIDQNARDIEENVTGAQHQLSRYMETVGSNRWLMMKIFAVLILFIVLWGVFAA